MLASSYAEQQYAAAWERPKQHREALARLELARDVFPFDHRLRNGVAGYLSQIRWKGSRALAIDAIREALIDDPFAMDLHRNLAGFLIEAGDKAGATREIEFVARHLPGRPLKIVVNVNPLTN